MCTAHKYKRLITRNVTTWTTALWPTLYWVYYFIKYTSPEDIYYIVYNSGHALLDVAPRPLAYWDFGFESCPGVLISVSCEFCVLWRRGLCCGPISRPTEYYRLRCVFVWSWSLEFEKALAHKRFWSHAKKKKHVTVFNTNRNGVWILLLRYASLYSFTPSPVRGSFASLTKIQSVNRQYLRLWLKVVTCKRFRVMACSPNTIPPLRKCTRFSACK